jgi:uncharacterized membrane protein
MLWMVAFAVLATVFALTIIGIPLAVVFYCGMIGVGFWAVYRIARGWLRLKDGRQP